MLGSTSMEKNVFSPMTINEVKIPNRLVMGSMHTGLEEEKDFGALTQFYVERAEGQVGLIVTGGFSPNIEGRLSPFAAQMSSGFFHLKKHRNMVEEVHKYPTRMLLQLLHAGRYSHHPFQVAPSAIAAPITRFRPFAMPLWLIKKTIRDFAHSAALAEQAGYVGVEIMGSEGYLINQFTAPKTNLRKDQYGGSTENRHRFAIEIVRAVRKAVSSKGFIIMFRLSLMDLVKNGSPFAEVCQLADALKSAGVDIINSGIGWHEARIPTIATMVPHHAFLGATAKLAEHIDLPLVAVNRFNRPEHIDEALKVKGIEFVSMARPLLADPFLLKKIQQRRSDEINTCIACNQACLDHVFENKRATCLVNPRAAFETELPVTPSPVVKHIVVAGAGPAGLSCAVTLAQRGHQVSLFEARPEIGGQFQLAQKIPGKSDFSQTLRYFKAMAESLPQLKVFLSSPLDPADIQGSIEAKIGNVNVDHFVLATGIRPRVLSMKGAELPLVIRYDELILGLKEAGPRVAVLGAGGIGFDVCEFLLHKKELSIAEFWKTWGLDTEFVHPGSILPQLKAPQFEGDPLRKVYMLKRSDGKFGASLGKTTGWVHRLSLKAQQVVTIDGAHYDEIVENGIYYHRKGKREFLEVDSIITCIGQESERSLLEAAMAQFAGRVHLIGGAQLASEVDAKRAIFEGFQVGRTL